MAVAVTRSDGPSARIGLDRGPGTGGRDAAEDANDVVLSVRGLRIYFDTPAGVVRAVDDVSFDLHRGDVLAIVGESGSGKSVTAQSIMRLVAEPPGRYAGGSVLMDGIDLLSLGERALERIRGKRISMIFQNPRAALNPSFSVSTHIVETLRRHDRSLSKDAAAQRAMAHLRAVDFPDPERVAASYPHQMSGGMCQRVGIALSMACAPEVLIADEPTTALDVLVQSTILLLLKRAHLESGIPIILITHDFGVVRALANRVVVMYAGKIQEQGPADAVLADPQHPYTRALIDSVPNPERSDRRLFQIKGQPPDLSHLAAGCSFAERCEFAMALCHDTAPVLHDSPTGSKVRCHLFAPDAGIRG
jgi:peptide/nickel transport system ATP-binding protein